MNRIDLVVKAAKMLHNAISALLREEEEKLAKISSAPDADAFPRTKKEHLLRGRITQIKKKKEDSFQVLLSLTGMRNQFLQAEGTQAGEIKPRNQKNLNNIF